MLKTINIITEANFSSKKAKNDKQNEEMRDSGRTNRVSKVFSRNKNLSANTKSKHSDKSKRKL